MLVLTIFTILITVTISTPKLPVCELCELNAVPGCSSSDGIEEECTLLHEQHRCYWANDSIINIGPDSTRECRNDADCIRLDGSEETPQCLRCCENGNLLGKRVCTETISTTNGACGSPYLNFFGTIAPCCPGHTCLDMVLGICGVIAEECDECMTWTGYEDMPIVNDNCADDLFCLTAGHEIEFNDIDMKRRKSKGKSKGKGSKGGKGGKGGKGRRRLEFRDQIIFDKGICVPLDGISQTVTRDCEDDLSCPNCMRCCLKDGRKQCLRATGISCGFESRGPCCCPDHECKMGECQTSSPTKMPSQSPSATTDPPTKRPTTSPSIPTNTPTKMPSQSPSIPTNTPSQSPSATTDRPTIAPTDSPTPSPSVTTNAPARTPPRRLLGFDDNDKNNSNDKYISIVYMVSLVVALVL